MHQFSCSLDYEENFWVRLSGFQEYGSWVVYGSRSSAVSLCTHTMVDCYTVYCLLFGLCKETVKESDTMAVVAQWNVITNVKVTSQTAYLSSIHTSKVVNLTTFKVSSDMAVCARISDCCSTVIQTECYDTVTLAGQGHGKGQPLVRSCAVALYYQYWNFPLV